MKNIYKSLYSKDILQLATNQRIKVMLKIVDDLNLQSKKILDIGCYDGTFLSQLKNRKNHFFGIEASDYGVRKCEEKDIIVKQFLFDDKANIPFEDNFFDLIVIGEIIEHIYDTDFFLNEIFRMLKKKGSLVISTPNIASFGRRIMLLFGINPIIEVSPNEPDSSGHIRYFTHETIKKLLGKRGFKIEKIESDAINISPSGKINLKYFAKLFPRLGQSIIILANKK